MSAKLFVYFFLSFITCVVNSIILEGTSWTRYHPCGLGLLHFDKVFEGVWRGTLDLNNYKKYVDFDMLIRFKENTIVMPTRFYDGVNFTKPDEKTLAITAVLLVHESIMFDTRAENGSTPVVTDVIVNYIMLCDDVMKLSSTITHYTPTSESCTRPHYKQKCGRKFPANEELLTVRSIAADGDWPWHAVLYVGDYKYGGTIVSQTALVTASYTVEDKDPSTIRVVAGVSNLLDTDQPGKQQLTVTEIIRHVEYKGEAELSNIAIVKVNRFAYTRYVQPICLWGPMYDKIELMGKEMIFVGYGRNLTQKENDYLRSTEMVMVKESECRKNYDEYNGLQFCTGFKTTPSDKVSYYGDVAGGLVAYINGPDDKITWYLRGIWTRCHMDRIYCIPSKYLLFADVAPYYSWIYYHSELAQENEVL